MASLNKYINIQKINSNVDWKYMIGLTSLYLLLYLTKSSLLNFDTISVSIMYGYKIKPVND